MINPHFSCKFFQHFDSMGEIDLNDDITISITQPELMLDPSVTYSQVLPMFHQHLDRPKVPFIQKEVEYKATYQNLNYVDLDKVPAIIPTKDSIELLKFTLANLSEHSVLDHILPVLVDDRSTNTEEIKELADHYNALYIRVDYTSPTFNFSVINNAAAALCHAIGFENIILWNSDLWVDNKETVPYLIQQHQENKVNDVYATGVKLLYPTKGFCELMDEDKFITSLAKDFGTTEDQILSYNPFGSVQFGGSAYVTLPFFKQLTPIINSPVHFGRFTKRELPTVNIDRQVQFMTGAFILCDLEKYKEVGALNPSMNSQFQDVDFCHRLNQSSYKIMWYGKDTHMLHAESMSLSSKDSSGGGMKSTHGFQVDMLSNQVLYASLWNECTLLGTLGV